MEKLQGNWRFWNARFSVMRSEKITTELLNGGSLTQGQLDFLGRNPQTDQLYNQYIMLVGEGKESEAKALLDSLNLPQLAALTKVAATKFKNRHTIK